MLAAAALAAPAGVAGAAQRAEKGKAVLAEALEAFARQQTLTLGAFVDYLADLPPWRQ